MAKNDYLKHRDEEFSAQLSLFKNNISAYATALGLSLDQVASQAADADYFAYCLAMQDTSQTAAQQWTGWKVLMRRSGKAGSPPAVVSLPTPVAAVAPGIEKRFRKLVRMVKSHPHYNTATGEALGIEAPNQAAPDAATLKPQLRLKISGTQVIIRWGWQGYRRHLDLIELHVDRGSGYQLLTYDSSPNFTDPTPFPQAAAQWKYKAIYRRKDQRVGQWSDEVSITVVG